ncbi:MAG: hypothetical protein IKK03_16065 [Lachnospiraceae bacterium]|nr:hypothetical protein [Lachnospiraceae bacterium]
MKFKKLVALLTVTALSISMLAGCGAKETEGSEVASAVSTETTSSENVQPSEENKEPDKLTIWVPENIRILDWETNKMTLWLEEQGNLDLEFVVLPAADYDTKVKMAMTVGDIKDLPDVILTTSSPNVFKESALNEYIAAGTILPLTEYYNNPELAVNINEAIERTGTDYTRQIISPDGEIYGIANFNQSYGVEYSDKMWIYKPWLDALGEDIPTTTEEYYQLLKKVSETDLNGNGKKDEIGLAGCTKRAGYIKYLMNSFVYAGDARYRVVEDGTLSYATVTEEWKEGLKYIRTLFEENLALSESQTMDLDQFKSLLNSEDNVVFSFVWQTAGDTERADDYICINPLVGPEGVQYASYKNSSPSIRFGVTVNCENPEAAFRLGDLMCSEYLSISQRWGEEGVNWDYAENVKNADAYTAKVDGFDLYIVAYDDAAYWSGKDPQNASWLQVGPIVRQYGIANGVGINPDTVTQESLNQAAADTLYQTSGLAPEETISTLLFNDEEKEVIADVESTLQNFVDEFVATALSGNIDIDAQWESYLKEIDKIGADALLEVYQAAYDRMYK